VVIWKSAVPGGDPAAYASAIVVEAAGVKQYVQFLGRGLVGVEARSGRFLWRYDKTAQGSPANIPTPIAQHGTVYSAAGQSGGGLIKLKENRGGVTAEEVYFAAKLPTAIGGAVLVGEHLYGTRGQALVCAQFGNGQLKWEDRSVAPGSVCWADGRLYLHGENGQVALVESTPAAYREKGRFNPPNRPEHGPSGSKAWTYPVVANGRLFIRDLGTVWCYDIQDPKRGGSR
jgi:outer membrane protein assembly factor BamB